MYNLKKAEEAGVMVDDVLGAVGNYLKLSKSIKQLEEELSTVKKKLTNELNKLEPNEKKQRILEIEEIAKCTLTDAVKETFSIKDAQEKFDEDTFKEYVLPFIKVSQYQMLKVSEK